MSFTIVEAHKTKNKPKNNNAAMRNIKILIIDSSPLYREVIKLLFSEDKIKPTFYEARDTIETISQADGHVTVDLIIIDSKFLQFNHKKYFNNLILKIKCQNLDS